LESRQPAYDNDDNDFREEVAVVIHDNQRWMPRA
jgi:hypothetical protein